MNSENSIGAGILTAFIFAFLGMYLSFKIGPDSNPPGFLTIILVSACVGYIIGKYIGDSSDKKNEAIRDRKLKTRNAKIAQEQQDNTINLFQLFKKSIDPTNPINKNQLFKKFFKKYHSHFDDIDADAEFVISQKYNKRYIFAPFIQLLSQILKDGVVKDYLIEYDELSKNLINKLSDLIEQQFNIEIDSNDILNVLMSNILNDKIKEIKSIVKNSDNMISAFYNTYQDRYKPGDLIILFYLKNGEKATGNVNDILNQLKALSKQRDLENFQKSLSSDDIQIFSIDDVDYFEGIEFEYFVARLMKKEGYKVSVTKASGDQGVDIIAEDLRNKIAIQAKCYSSNVTNTAVQEVIAGSSYYECNKAMVVTNAYFTPHAIELANANGVELVDRDKLINLIEKHY